MERMKKGKIYKILWMEPQENQYMDNLVDNVNTYLDKLYDFIDIKNKAIAYSSRKHTTVEELKKQYDNLVKNGYIKTQRFEDYFYSEKEKELEYDNIVSKIDKSFLDYEMIANRTLTFLKARRDQFYSMEQTLLNAGAFGLGLKLFNSEDSLNRELEKAKLRFAIQQIDEKVKTIEEEVKNNKLIVENISNKTVNKKKQSKHDIYLTNYEKRLAKYYEELKKYEEDCKKIIITYNKFLNKEIEKEDFEKIEAEMCDKYKEITVRYTNFCIYRDKVLDKVKHGKVWHPSLTKSNIKELNSLGVNTPSGNLYLNYLKNKNFNINYISEPKAPKDFHKLLEKVLKIHNEEQQREKQEFNNEVEKRFEEANAKWDSYGPLYKLIHRKNKPKREKIELELLKVRSR